MLGRLFKRNPTKDFKRAIVPPFNVDADRRTLSGLPMAASLEELAPLGEASFFETHRGGHYYLEYGDLGITVGFLDGTVDTLCFPMSLLEDVVKDPSFRPSSVRIRPQRLTISQDTLEADIQQAFGVPRERDVDDEGVSLQYDIGPLVYEFDFKADGAIVMFSIYMD